MNNDTKKREINAEAVGGSAAGRKPYEAPKLIVHGTVETLTKANGLLLTDNVLTGSVVTTISILG